MMLATTSVIQWISAFGVKRSIIGSDIVIIVALIIHSGEGITLLITDKADWPIPMHALLTIFGNRWIAALVLISAVVMGVIGQWSSNINLLLRIVLLTPQWTLLLLTAGSAVAASVMGTYVNFIPPSGIGIFWDQASRILMPIMYFFAAWARAKDR